MHAHTPLQKGDIMLRRRHIVALVLSTWVIAGTRPALAGHDGHGHTHIGRNPDGLWGTADDDQLWIFATPDDPQWGPIDMAPTGEFIGGLQVYRAELDCWHTAHPPTRAFQLGGSDPAIMPDWRIGIRRESVSDPVHFWMQDEATGLDILFSDGDILAFGSPVWAEDLHNENGTLGAWHYHVHTEFLALAPGPGAYFDATFTALDLGATGLAASAPYTIAFQTIPEPASLLFLTLGAGIVARRRYGIVQRRTEST